MRSGLFVQIGIITMLSPLLLGARASDPDHKMREIESLLAKKRSALEDLESKKKSFLDAVGELDETIADLREEWSSTGRSVDQLEQRIADLEKRERQMKEEIEETKARLKKNAMTTFCASEGSFVTLFVTQQKNDDFALKRYALQNLAKRDLKLLQKRKELNARVIKQKDDINASLAQLLQQRDRLNKQTNLLKNTREDRQKAITRLNRDKAQLEKSQQELIKRHKELSALVKKLLQESAAKASKNDDDTLPKNYFAWPLEGKLVRRFGEKGKSTAEVESAGLHIQAPMGTKIQAAQAGKVVYVGFMRGFGLVVIIDHKDAIHSLYAHLENAVVKVGDYVKDGETIGGVGDSESLDGPQLYFELRKNGIPKNPIAYLKK